MSYNSIYIQKYKSTPATNIRGLKKGGKVKHNKEYWNQKNK